MDPRHAILFEPVRIGPVTAPNRFYQTPHAAGLWWQRPMASLALSMRRVGGTNRADGFHPPDIARSPSPRQMPQPLRHVGPYRQPEPRLVAGAQGGEDHPVVLGDVAAFQLVI